MAEATIKFVDVEDDSVDVRFEWGDSGVIDGSAAHELAILLSDFIHSVNDGVDGTSTTDGTE